MKFRAVARCDNCNKKYKTIAMKGRVHPPKHCKYCNSTKTRIESYWRLVK